MRVAVVLALSCALLAATYAKKESSKEDKKEKEDYGTVIGIDLGTTYSV